MILKVGRGSPTVRPVAHPTIHPTGSGIRIPVAEDQVTRRLNGIWPRFSLVPQLGTLCAVSKHASAIKAVGRQVRVAQPGMDKGSVGKSWRVFHEEDDQ
jgi:hypothetical protein